MDMSSRRDAERHVRGKHALVHSRLTFYVQKSPSLEKITSCQETQTNPLKSVTRDVPRTSG